MAARPDGKRRATIADIARLAGVSKGAVSFALNDQPGISDATRQRVKAIADELGWRPNRAARALSAARVGACGLILARPTGTLAFEPFFSGLMSGIESELGKRSIALVLQMVPDLAAEQEALRRWWAEHRVDGVLLVDLRVDDPRIELVEQLGLPTVVVGGPGDTGEVSYVASDDQRGMQEIVRYLLAIGHRRIARVAGPPDLLHTVRRTESYRAALSGADATMITVCADYSSPAAATSTRRLLASPQAPTAIVYDNDVMAVAGLGVAQEMGVTVPGELSLVSFEDSVLCELVHPPLTAWTRDVVEYGALAARTLIARLEGEPAGTIVVPGRGLMPRGSTAPTVARQG